MSKFYTKILFVITGVSLISSCAVKEDKGISVREIISVNEGWSFYKYNKEQQPDNLIYDVRPEISQNNEYLVADAKPTEALELEARTEVLKPWILPAANNFIKDKIRQQLQLLRDKGIIEFVGRGNYKKVNYGNI